MIKFEINLHLNFTLVEMFVRVCLFLSMKLGGGNVNELINENVSSATYLWADKYIFYILPKQMPVVNICQIDHYYYTLFCTTLVINKFHTIGMCAVVSHED